MTITPTEQGRRVLGVLDEFIANMTKARDDLQAVLDAVTPLRTADPEPTATVETMTPGGWMQRPGSPRWLPIAEITECAGVDDCWCITFALKSTDPDGTFIHVGRDDSFPFLTAEQFDRDCDAERSAA